MQNIFTQSYYKTLYKIFIVVVVAALLSFTLLTIPLSADTDPVTCDSTGVSLSLTVLRADGTTSVGAGTVVPGETIKYRATLGHAGGTNCNYEGGDLDIITPDGANNDVDGGAIPLVDSGTPFVGSLAIYVVDSADVAGGFLPASAVYTGGTSHLGGPDVSPVGANTPASTFFEKLNPPIETEVHDASHTDITNQSVFEGTEVHDKATVLATSTGPIPTGTVSFSLYDNLTCDGGLLDFEGGISLDGSGMASSTPFTPTPGDYSYLVTYSGDDNYEDGSAECEPVTVEELPTGEIHGQKFEDVDGDGIWDEGEPVLSGWTINITGPDQFASSTVTDNEGFYWFMDLLPGIYEVSEDVQQGWVQTLPVDPDTYTIDLEADEVSEGNDFGNFELAMISGKKFHDLNADGIRTNGTTDPNILGWTIKLDLVGTTTPPTCESGTIETASVNGEFCEVLTDEFGNYKFNDLGPGQYSVSEELQEGWMQTRPTDVLGGEGAQGDGTYLLTVESGDNIDDRQFGNFQKAAIHGMKFEDMNGDGNKDDGDAGLSGWTINITGPDQFASSTVTDQDGNYWFMDLLPGEYTVTEENQGGWVQTTGDPQPIDLESGDEILSVDFGNLALGSIHGMKFEDMNGDGIKDEGDTGLENWIIELWQGENLLATTTTNGEGNYWFMDLVFGDYAVCEVQQDGWEQTFPEEDGCHNVVIDESGNMLEGNDFGNVPLPGSIHGVKWFDDDLNGEINEEEGLLSGWTIFLDLNHNGELDEGDVATTTMADNIETELDETGWYWFEDIQPGEYWVCEVQQDGWFGVNVDENNCREVVLGAGETRDDVHFGNHVFEGCTPGYWKQEHHFGNWGQPPFMGDLFSDYFEDAFPGETLLDALKFKGGKFKALARHTVAALLNTYAIPDTFGLTTGEVIDLFNDAWPGGDWKSALETLSTENERGCPLGRAELEQ